MGFYQWSRGVQIRANLDLMMDWFQSIGLGELATDFFQKLSAAVNLLATPKETLLQVRGRLFLLELLAAAIFEYLRQRRFNAFKPAERCCSLLWKGADPVWVCSSTLAVWSRPRRA